MIGLSTSVGSRETTDIKFGGNYQQAYTDSLRNRARTGLAAGYATDSVGEIEQLLLGKMDLADRNFGDTHRHITQRSSWDFTARTSGECGPVCCSLLACAGK